MGPGCQGRGGCYWPGHRAYRQPKPTETTEAPVGGRRTGAVADTADTAEGAAVLSARRHDPGAECSGVVLYQQACRRIGKQYPQSNELSSARERRMIQERRRGTKQNKTRGSVYVTDNREREVRNRSYDCVGLPDYRLSDFELLAFYRECFGNQIVNEQIAVLGADRVIDSMQRSHRAHLAASGLSPREPHQRAGMVESLMIELGVGGVGGVADGETDVQRMQMFVEVVKGLADTIAEQQLRDEAIDYVSYDDMDEADEYITDAEERPF